MGHFHDEEMSRLRELLRHAGEFIAYFELAESKMMNWRQEIEQKYQAQEQYVARQFQSLRVELQSLQNLLSETGLARLRTSSEDILKQGESHINLLKATGNQLIGGMAEQQYAFRQLSMDCLDALDQQLASHSTQALQRIAADTCEQVEKTAVHTLQRSTSLWQRVQWRSTILALVTTVFTIFSIGLYINNELPWEIHRRAINEREAGKALLKAWPILSQEEKNKIMRRDG